MAEPATLSALAEQLAGHARERERALRALGLDTGEYPQLPAVEEFRRMHGQLRMREQLHASLKPPPADAGPLNSASLAHRALAVMRAASPGYLRHFIQYLDSLSWLEQIQPAAGAKQRARGQQAAPARRTRGRKRKPAR